MRLKSFLTAILASCAASCVLKPGAGTAHNFQTGPPGYQSPERPATTTHQRSQQHASQRIKFKRDGTVTGFLDDEYASDKDWEKFTNKGGALMCGLNGDDEEAGGQMGDTRKPPSAASTWTGDFQHDLTRWKWTETNPATYSCKMDEYWNVPAAMKALGLNGKPHSEGGDNVCYRVEHWNPKTVENGRQIPAINQWYNVDGTGYQATKGYYEFGINRAGGALYGFFLDSPVYAAAMLWYNNRKPADPAKLPKLRAFSDILWGYWSKDNPNIKNVSYFFMMHISNDQTNALIATCLHNKQETLKEWPGVAFDTKSDEGHALLGSPNGAAFAYFLMQHKAQLGRKTITKVTVFRAETDDEMAFVDPNLVFHVEDVEGKGKDEKPEDGTELNDKGQRQDRGAAQAAKL